MLIKKLLSNKVLIITLLFLVLLVSPILQSNIVFAEDVITVTDNRANSTLTINTGQTIKGNGVLGELTVNNGAVLAPGLSPGCLSSGNLSLTSGSTFQLEIEGTTVCTEYDQTRVTGTVSVTDATLSIDRTTSFIPSVNDEFILITNDGTDAVTGEFVDMVEGSTTVVDGVTYQISYVGGGGNDIMLTVVDVEPSVAEAASELPGAPDTGFSVDTASPLTTMAVSILSTLGIIIVARRLATTEK